MFLEKNISFFRIFLTNISFTFFYSTNLKVLTPFQGRKTSLFWDLTRLNFEVSRRPRKLQIFWTSRRTNVTFPTREFSTSAHSIKGEAWCLASNILKKVWHFWLFYDYFKWNSCCLVKNTKLRSLKKYEKYLKSFDNFGSLFVHHPVKSWWIFIFEVLFIFINYPHSTILQSVVYATTWVNLKLKK